jgi:2-polyprenyl-3-methyl-5-hydroxy-6-metoxy-1,4-benzoquinol methylase
MIFFKLMGMSSSLKKKIKPLLSERLVSIYKKNRLKRIRKRNRERSASDVFTEVYRKNLWGGRPGEFRSGLGSDDDHTDLYCTMIKEYIDSFEKPEVVVVDLGCGDFRVGKKIMRKKVKYIGVDVVPELISNNKKLYETPHVEFFCRDITSDVLPDGDICLIRQVFQHLSNSQISAVLRKLDDYTAVFITEHYPEDLEHCVPNLDKPHGGDTRLHDNSAVFLDKPPFGLKGIELILEIPYAGNKGSLRTFRLRKNSDSERVLK